MKTSSIVGFGLVMVIVGIAVKLLIVWVVASAIISGAKAGMDKCGEKWPISEYVSDDWFCNKGVE